ncbi:A/G-specific adenine glycosylase [Formosa algae]|uniref:Adenine DNA glycosylase n=1 Tax=Formosa algae TaxID=225843 RepID=A0A9X1CCI1_9FLAO|nr:A/G-specific adenine glycosylase [Formosa algae]MBP1840260.1 A/G-specific adenine glycosylase [Formosa algae]MDQ0334124.1 A/G-specific adenine glycosylase [Formosa algae]OEI79449.1 A/G-specific adenine glycosylase [Formosa algae]
MSFSKTLTDWYSVNKRQLPWRQTTNPYYIWLSEIILQQTQIKQGLPYYEDFVTTFPTVFDLAHANEAEVLKLWQGLGYYSRARNLHFAAKYVVNERDGVFPKTYKDLLKLKGVGDYTASAIASICYNEVSAVVDGNVYRLLSRYFGIYTPINSSKGAKEFKALAQELIDKKDPATFNQAVMEFGAVQCKPKSPDCSVCPFITSCYAFGKDVISDLPVKIKAAKVTKKYFNFLVFLTPSQTTFLEQRQGKGIWQNLYQFPLIESKSALTQAQLQLELDNLEVLKDHTYEVSLYNKDEIVHKLSHQHLYTRFWIVDVDTNIKGGIPVTEVEDFPVPILIGNFIEAFNF